MIQSKGTLRLLKKKKARKNMKEHQTRNVSKTLEDNNKRLANTKKEIFLITIVLNDFSRTFS